MVKNIYSIKEKHPSSYSDILDLQDVDDNIKEFGTVKVTNKMRAKRQMLLNAPQRLESLTLRLSSCGQWAKNMFSHKACGTELKTTYTKFYCTVRYCKHTECIVKRYAETLEEFKSIDRLKGSKGNELRKLWHFVIGFPHISMYDFQNNWKAIKKDLEYRMNKLWRRLKNRGVVIEAIKALDFSFEHKDGTVYPHYHFGGIPPKTGQGSQILHIINEEIAKLIKSSKKPSQLVFTSFKNKKKEAILAYLAKRATGLYTWDERPNKEYNAGKGKLRKDIESGKYYGLADFLTIKQYFDNFYGARHYATVGGLPRGSTLTSILEGELPDYCPICKCDLERDDLSVETTMNVVPPDKYLHKH